MPTESISVFQRFRRTSIFASFDLIFKAFLNFDTFPLFSTSLAISLSSYSEMSPAVLSPYNYKQLNKREQTRDTLSPVESANIYVLMLILMADFSDRTGNTGYPFEWEWKGVQRSDLSRGMCCTQMPD